jgi:hypothetical protein
MIKEEFITINGHSRNLKHFKSLGYDISVGSPCQIKTIDLMPGTTTVITTICDFCSGETRNTFKDYFIYTKGLIEPFFCKKCNPIKNKKTSLDNWGVDNPMKSTIVRDKLKKSILDKYGVEHYSNTDEYKIKYKETCKEKYGVENSFQVEGYKEKSKSKIREKWGVDYYLQTKELRDHSKIVKEDKSKKRFEKLLSDEYIINEYTDETFKITHTICNKDLIITKSLLNKRVESGCIVCTICNPINIQESYIEMEIKSFINSLNIGVTSRDRKLLEDKELDIFLPDLNLAIEVNGIYWHNELFKSKNYHLDKTIKSQENGVFLMHIWEDDWLNKKEIVKSIIRNRLSKIDTKIPARKCQIRAVDTKQEKLFLNANHIQGWSSSQIKLGLYFGNELVSLMTFGWRWTNSKKEMELIRFCNKINTSVVGASSKLFKFFKDNYEFEKVISYSDYSIFDGSMYKNLGFNKVSLSEPNYFWVVDKVRRHRYNYSKKKLVARGFDKDKTEVRIMHEQGYYRVWGCGQWRWEWMK